MTDIQAKVRYLAHSAQKVRSVIDMVRGKSANEALETLRFVNKGAAQPVFKLFGHESRLRVEHPDCDHDFPPAMRETAYLVNTARGPIVDEAALVDALRDGQIAAMDKDFGPGINESRNTPAGPFPPVVGVREDANPHRVRPPSPGSLASTPGHASFRRVNLG